MAKALTYCIACAANVAELLFYYNLGRVVSGYPY